MRPKRPRDPTGPPARRRRGATFGRVQTTILTSQSSPIAVGWVPLPPPCAGALGLTIAPGRRGPSLDGRTMHQRNLGTDLMQLRERHGVRRLVCCMEDHELERSTIAGIVERAAALGIEVHRLPIRDGAVPEDRRALERLLEELRGALRTERVVVHCLGGLGRSGTVAGCLLVDLGVPIGEALSRLVQARGPRCPETPAQRDFIRRWAVRRRPS